MVRGSNNTCVSVKEEFYYEQSNTKDSPRPRKASEMNQVVYRELKLTGVEEAIFSVKRRIPIQVSRFYYHTFQTTAKQKIV